MKKLPLILLLTSLTLPLFASAQTNAGSTYQFQQQGIFGCNQNGAYAMSVGALSAIGGTYVPVSDAAVELNTGTLVYKECVLREVVDAERQSAMSTLLQKAVVDIQTGNTGQLQGNPLYVVNQNNEIVLDAGDPTLLAMLQGNTFQNINGAFQTNVKDAVAQTYAAERGSPQTILTCPIQNNIMGLETAQPGTFDWSDFFNESDPACYPLGAADLAQNLVDSRISQAYGNLEQQWDWGGGFYPRVDANGNVVTPASVVAQSFEQILQSPIQQEQSANDLGQMIGALYAGVTTQVVGDSNGLTGLTQSVGGAPSYIDQIQEESQQGLQTVVTNTALAILTAAQQIESQYNQLVNAIATTLTQSSQQLQSAENQCWTAIIQKVCATPLAANNTCNAQGTCTDDGNGDETCSAGPMLQIATSTEFSSAVIGSQITPLVAPTAADLSTSNQALQLIANLIAGVSNTSSNVTQQTALDQLDTLVAQHQLHTPTDLQNVSSQQQAVQNQMTTLVTQTVQTWSGTGTDSNGNPLNTTWNGSITPGAGWCNVNNSGTIQQWVQTWTKK